MFKLLHATCALLAAFVFVGCSSDDAAARDKNYPSIHIEPSDSYRGSSREIEMPVTGLRYNVIGRPVVPEGNFLATSVYEVGSADLRRKVLLVQLDRKASNELYAIAGKAQGKRLFLLVGDRPVGVHRIVESLADGNIFFDVETPGASTAEQERALFKLSDDLNEAILKIRNEKESK